MRIIAGKYKRTNLNTLEGELTRPTKDMVKEALFSSIDINSDTMFLDLFSGSGAIGLEALSRGAKDCIFNDSNKDAVRIIKENLDKVHENRTVYNLDYVSCLNRIKGTRFDYIYLDPPYAFGSYISLFHEIVANDLLKESSIIIVEIRKDVDLNDSIENLKCFKEKKYGITKIKYYRKEEII